LGQAAKQPGKIQEMTDPVKSNESMDGPNSWASAPFEAIGETLPAKIHELLEEAIIRGDLAPSSRLNPDDIAARYGVSRIPVREALRSLHEAGWVDIRPRLGTYVRERSMTELKELFEARSGIEAHIAELAATRRTEEDLRQLEAIVNKGKASVTAGDTESTSRASVEFHNAIRGCCGNSLLASLAASLEKRARFYFSMVEGNLGSDWINVEEQLVQSIRKRDSSQAGKTARDHISRTGLAVSKFLETLSEA
jgi:DNA-binding GntR family transcriptional regulator